MSDIGEAGGFGLSDVAGPYYAPGGGFGTETTLPDGSVIYTDPVSGYRQIDSPGVPEAQNVFGSGQRDNGSAFEAVQSGILAGMGGTPASMFFENSDLALRITAMEQEGTADVLSAPKVTTKSGNEAIMRVVEVHRYPQDYDVETGQRTAPVVKPQDWEDYDLGVVLKVTPVVDTDTNTIDLDLLPEITKFKGFDDYIVGYNAYETGNNVGVTVGNGNALLARMPFFEKRSVQTQVTISDGHTVLMGGLVDERTETFRDQVPFLGDIPYIGRFFRTEGSRTAKKNLVIYVKATQVDSRGMTSDDRKVAHTTATN
jgi:type II secretory pathway component GspD/PulD (secretin)